MSRPEELAYHQTPLGDLVLRRRPEPRLRNIDVYEVKLGEEFLMSSLFTEGERQLAFIGLEGLEQKLDVIVGGLGLGYTAAAVLENENVQTLTVIETFAEVIGWHNDRLVPMGEKLSSDQRCTFLQADFFALASTGFDAADSKRVYDAVLLDIDHTPHNYLDEKNAGFYTGDGLAAMRGQIKTDGVFALWSDDPVEEAFRGLLEEHFGEAIGHDIEFKNPYTGGSSINSVYVATNKLAEIAGR